MREFRCAAKASVDGVERPRQRGKGQLGRIDRQRSTRIRRIRVGKRQRSLQPRVLLGDRLRLLAIGGGDPRKKIGKTGQAVARSLREIRSPEEGRLVRRQEHRQRPAAAPLRQHRVRRLIDLIEIGPFLAVDLDVDEQVVHQRRDALVLERFVRHDVAPMAGGIADREKNRLVLAPGTCERLIAPWIPVDRITRVLKQVRARLPCQSIRHYPRPR